MGEMPVDSQQLLGVHPILSCAETIEAALRDVAGGDPGFMRTGEKAEALQRLDRLGDRVTALRLRVMAEAGEVAEATADHSVATWLAAETRTDPRGRCREWGLPRSLTGRWTRLGEALGGGAVNLAQARVIAHALDDLPVREVGADAAATSLSLRRLGDGTTRLSGPVSDAVADRLRTYLDAYAAPRHRGIGEGDRYRPGAGSGRRAERSWRPPIPIGCRCTVAMRRRCWSPWASRRCARSWQGSVWSVRSR
jgi:hypothetical protein